MLEKDYINWSKVKSDINNAGQRPNNFHPRQIWWCSIGENIGAEVDGKNEKKLRPVLIIKSFNSATFFGVPLTSQPQKTRNQKHYFSLSLYNKNSKIMLSQARTWDALRLVRPMATLDYGTFKQIKNRLRDYLGLS